MTNEVPLLDLHAQFRTIEPEIRKAIDAVLASQRFILGPEVESLEKECADYVSCKYGIAVSSGSDALLVALMALGIKEGDEIITSPHTFFATAGAIARLGAKPVFCDIELQTYNLDPTQVKSKVTSRTKAFLPVDLFGQSADLAPLVELSQAHSIPIIEDAAQAIGTEYQGKRVGSFGQISCFSFFPSKNLGAMGDAGLVTTHDAALAEKLRVLRSHGSKPKYFHKYIGGNFRMDALQAAILRVKLRHLESWTSARQKNADRYDHLFRDAGLEEVVVPWRRPKDRHIFNQYVLRVPRRDELKKFLADKGIQTEIYYPLPMHLQECFAYLGHKKGDFPKSEEAANHSIAIPIFPELTSAQQEMVVSAIRSFYRS